MSGPDGESPGPRHLPDQLEIDDREEITSLRTALQARLDEAGAANDDEVVSLSTLDGRSIKISARTYQTEIMPRPGEKKHKWQMLRRSPKTHSTKVYYIDLPSDPTTPPRTL